MRKPIVILGAGIAGLSMSYFLAQRGIPSIVLEKNPYYGGLARSFRWNDFWCDFAAHRFYAHDQEVLDCVRSLTPMIEHYRRSRIFFKQRWLRDPIDIIELFSHLSMHERWHIVQDYLRRDKTLPDHSFEQYVAKRYGHALYDIFFRCYTERLFSLSGQDIAVEWAIWKVRLSSPLDRLKNSTRTKFRRFYYPISGGYGAIVNGLYQKIQDQVILNAQVTSFIRDQNGQVQGITYRHYNQEYELYAQHIISTLPLTVIAQLLGEEIKINYQKVDAVYLLLNKPLMSNNHWLYFMDSSSTINRLVEFKNMSNYQTPPHTTVVCAEVTIEAPNIIERVVNDLVQSRLIQPHEVIDTHVIREPFAYPRYSRGYINEVQRFQQVLQHYPNIHILGRSAQFTHYEVDDLLDQAYQMAQQITTTQPITIQSTNKEPPVWIVILTLNNYHDTEECLRSLQSLDYPSYNIILVDNGSSDNTPDLVRKQFPNVKVIENHYNLGVAAGYNVGIHYALDNGAEYIFILNNDTTVDPLIITHLVQAAREPNAGILMPIVYYYHNPQQVWSAGARYRAFPPAIVMERKIYNTYHDLQFAISCGFLITRHALEKAGLFDESFRFLWDDLDFSQRVRRAGLRILQVPQAKMWHKVSQTTNPASEQFWRTHGESSVIFFRRHRQSFPLPQIFYLGYFALREFIFKRRLKSLPSFLQGIRSGQTKQLVDVPLPKDRMSYP
ncbi:glycosyltransferase [Chloroflexus sp.]|uniref:glycosyltransferase n=1 Tax=Chloroflexus sp. TaxID=1904827 RepID=UPI003C746083